MKDKLLVMISAAVGVAYAHIGGWATHLKVLVGMIVLDFLAGLILTFFGKSKKSKERVPDSKIATNGFLRKCLCLVMVGAGYLLDMLVGSSFVSDMLIVSFIMCEVLSLTEHARRAGVKIPKKWEKVLDILKEKAGEVEPEKCGDGDQNRKP